MERHAAMLIALRFMAAAAAVYLLKQVRKPTKYGGRFFLWIMNKSHSPLTDWGLKHVRIDKDFAIPDVGCGGGRTIQKPAAFASDGNVFGVDYASGSVAASTAKNAELIRAGRVRIAQASVSHLPFAEHTFDLVTAVETQYYWPSPVEDMAEILRVLKPSGTLVVIAESYKKGARDKALGPAMKLLRPANLGVEQHCELFKRAGFTEVEIFEECAKGWLCGTGKKSPHEHHNENTLHDVSKV
jgi:SAM-dependent methyltransferase